MQRQSQRQQIKHQQEETMLKWPSASEESRLSRLVHLFIYFVLPSLSFSLSLVFSLALSLSLSLSLLFSLTVSLSLSLLFSLTVSLSLFLLFSLSVSLSLLFS